MPAGFPPNPSKLNAIKSLYSRAGFVLAIKIALAVVVVAVVAFTVRPEVLFETARSADVWWLAVAVALLPANIVVEAVIWLPLLRLLLPETRLLSAVRGVIGGYPLGFFTPGRVGEFAGRAWSMASGDRTEIGISVAAARLPELAVLLLAGLAAVLASISSSELAFRGQALFVAITAASTAIVWAAVLLPSRAAVLARRLTKQTSITSRLEFLERVDNKIILSVVSLSFLRLVVYCSQFVFLAAAFAPHASFSTMYRAVLATFTAKAIIPPITFLDVGIREGAAAFFFDRFGFGAAVGFNAAACLFAINVVLPTLIGLPLISRYRLGRRVSPTSELETTA
ncbi:MAG: flippase-like domain-containing protein [Rhodothermia bacterium]|nr:flippase-like domain-containing protein [Rhodothermia bacterium]